MTSNGRHRTFTRAETAGLCLLAILWLVPWSSTAQQGSDDMSKNEVVIREFIAAWSNLDAAELASYFTEDGTYHNIPSQPVRGRDNVQAMIAGFTRPWQSTRWEIVSLVAEGDLVVAERVDRTVVNGQPVDLPVVGVFEMRDGRIHVWRDYFDLNTYTDQLNKALGQPAN